MRPLTGRLAGLVIAAARTAAGLATTAEAYARPVGETGGAAACAIAPAPAGCLEIPLTRTEATGVTGSGTAYTFFTGTFTTLTPGARYDWFVSEKRHPGGPHPGTFTTARGGNTPYTAATDGEVHVDDGDDVTAFGASGPGDYSIPGLVGLWAADNVVWNQNVRPAKNTAVPGTASPLSYDYNGVHWTVLEASRGPPPRRGPADPLPDRGPGIRGPRVPRRRDADLRQIRVEAVVSGHDVRSFPLVGTPTPDWTAGKPKVSPEIVAPGEGTTYLESAAPRRRREHLDDPGPGGLIRSGADPSAVLHPSYTGMGNGGRAIALTRRSDSRRRGRS